MANLLDSIVKGYTTGMNNQLNAQKAYIDSYITGINARNAVNQEARTKDQYWNYTQPLGQSNLANIQAKNNIETGMLTNQDYINNIQGYGWDNAAMQFKLGRADMDNLPNYIETQGNNAKTGTATSGYNLKNANFNLGQQDAVNEQKALDIANSGDVGEWQRKSELVKAKQYYESLTNPTGTTTDGTTTDGTTTIMLQKGGKTPTGMFGTDGRLNFTGTTTTPASGLTSVNNRDWSLGKAEDARWNAASASQGKTLPQPTGQQTGQVNLNSNPYYQNYSADQIQSALGNLTSSTDSILGSTPDIFLSPERRARKIAFNQNYELMIQARDAKLAEQKAQRQIENQAYLKRLTDKALERQRTNSGLK